LEPANNYKWASVADLFAFWTNYAVKAGEWAGSEKRFHENMVRRGLAACKKDRSTIRAFEGVRLNAPVSSQMTGG
jgi:hypothetical protein